MPKSVYGEVTWDLDKDLRNRKITEERLYLFLREVEVVGNGHWIRFWEKRYMEDLLQARKG